MPFCTFCLGGGARGEGVHAALCRGQGGDAEDPAEAAQIPEVAKLAQEPLEGSGFWV